MLTWLDQPTMDRETLADLCERSLYQLVRTALNDDRIWEEVLRRIDDRP